MDHFWTSALVTWGSSGIGEAFARSLGAAGVDVVLVARREDRLGRLADALRSPTTSVELLAADLTGSGGRAAVAQRLAAPDRPIDLWVNCAGIGASGPFADGQLARYRQIVDLNIEAV